MLQDEECERDPAWLSEARGEWDRVPLELLELPDCPCCVEVEAVPEPVRWDVPGVRCGDPAPEVRLPEPSPVVSQLLAVVERVASADPAGVTEPQALVDAQLLLQAAQVLRVHNLRRVADVQVRQLHGLTSARSTQAWLRQVAPDRPVGDLALARKLLLLPVLRERVESGRLSLQAGVRVAGALWKARGELDGPDGLVDGQPTEQVLPAVVREVLAQVAGCRLGMRDDDPVLLALSAALERVLVEERSQLGMLERAFVLLAEHVPLTWLTGCLQVLLDALLPNELERRADRQDGQVLLQHRGSGRGWDLRGDLDDETGELMHLLLTRAAQGDDENAQDTADAEVLRAQGLHPWDEPGGGGGTQRLSASPTATGRPRSRPRRWHDALTRLLHAALAAEALGTRHKAPVRMVVTVREELLAGAPGAPPAVSGSGHALPRALVRRWWCDASVTPYLLSRGFRVLGVAHTTRTITATERTALDLRSGGHRCAGLGCCPGQADPLTGLEPHHVDGWASSGRTALAETVWACPGLHHDLHHGRTVQLRDGRRLTESGWVEPA